MNNESIRRIIGGVIVTLGGIGIYLLFDFIGSLFIGSLFGVQV